MPLTVNPTALKTLATSLATLMTSVQDTMSFFYSAETATINAKDRNPYQFRDEFTEMRRLISDEWKCMVHFLKQCYEFSDRAACLVDIWETCDDNEAAHYFRELVASSGTLVSDSQSLSSHHHRVCRDIARHLPALTFFLQHLSSPQSPFAFSKHNEVAISSSHSGDFIQSSILTAHPNGLTALSLASKALRETDIALSEVSQFWATFHERHRSAPDDESRTLLMGDRLMQECAENKEIILTAIAHLDKVSDALTIEAVGARPKHANPSRGSSRQFSTLSESSVKLKRRPGAQKPRLCCRLLLRRR